MAYIKNEIMEKLSSNISLTTEENAEVIEDLINSCSFDEQRVGIKMTNIHRYLQSKFFQMALSFIVRSALNYENGYYDGRNEYACKWSKVMLDGIEKEDAQYAKCLKTIFGNNK